MRTDIIKWVEINWNIFDTINDNRSIIGSTEEPLQKLGKHLWWKGCECEAICPSTTGEGAQTPHMYDMDMGCSLIGSTASTKA